MAVEPLSTLSTVAAIIGLGFLGYLLFERTRVTDVLILIGFGVLIGPLLGVFDVDAFKGASALVGTLALIIIMFDGGLGLKLRDLLTGIARSTVLAVLGVTLSVAAVAVVGHYALGLDGMTAVLLGTIVGGTSGVIIMPIINRTSANEATRVTLSVESALTDVLCVMGAVTLIALLATPGSDGAFGAGEAQSTLRSVAAQFSVAIVLGLVAGFAWLRLLRALVGKRNSYMLTLAAVLALYTGSESAGGNGAIAVLIFGVVVGNGYLIARKLDFAGLEVSHEHRRFQGEITFLVRVFFFVYLGVILDPSVLTQSRFLVEGALILGALLLVRVVAVAVATWRDPDTEQDRGLMTFLMPRGLAAAVLAGLPAQAGIPGTEAFVAYAFLIIVATNAVGTGAVVLYEVKKKRSERAQPVMADVAVEGDAPAAR